MQPRTLIAGLALVALVFPAFAAEQKQKSAGGKKATPPMLVAVDEVVAGAAEPMQELVGTVYFSRVSNVAAEVDGLVASVAVEEGDRVKKGDLLISLQTDILDTQIDKTRNAYEQVVLDMEQARKDLRRLESLHDDNLIATTTYESQLTRARGLEKQVASLKAELDRLNLNKAKMMIRSPFNGLVLNRDVEKGEWVKVGGTVAVVADDSEVDVVVDVPERLVGLLEKGREVSLQANGRRLTGRYVALVPRGDIATRTFSIKIRSRNRAGLIEGMAATALLPADQKIEGLLVPRDAVTQKFGRDIVFSVVDGQAKMVPVEVTGYAGMKVGVDGDGLEVGQPVVVKGNERIRDGQPVRMGQ